MSLIIIDKMRKNIFTNSIYLVRRPRFITPQHIFFWNNINRFEKSVSYIFDKIKLDKNSAKIITKFGIENCYFYNKKKARTIETIMKVYKPFIYDYNYTFKSDNLLKHRALLKKNFRIHQPILNGKILERGPYSWFKTMVYHN